MLKVLAIDFDGVIHDPKNVDKGFRMGKPIEKAVESMIYLAEKGYVLIIHSVRANNPSGKKSIEDWCRFFRIPFNQVTSEKPDADLYIDNKGIHFENWQETLLTITGKLDNEFWH